MASGLKWIGIVLIVVVLGLAAAQFVQPARSNPPVDPSRTIAASLGAASPVVAVLDRSCGDCHSNATVWSGAARIAPLSWIMAEAVGAGRKAVNFSDWAGYPPDQQRALLAQSCQDASSGKMPGGAWTMFHPEARLSATDVQTLCAAARRQS